MPSAAPIRLKDVAERAGVAVSTVSMALKDHPAISAETKHRVRQASHEVGYRVPTRRGQDRVAAGADLQRLGFVVLGTPAHEEGYAALAFELAAAAGASEIRLEISSIVEVDDPGQVLERLLAVAREVDGLLLSGRLPAGAGLKLLDTGVRALVLGHLLQEAGTVALQGRVCQVGFDNLAMGERATRRLLDLGHRRIGFACETLYPGLSHERFRAGYHLALLAAGLPVDPLLDGSGRSMAAAVDAYCGLDVPPTAYIVPDARDAAALLAELRSRGREPAPGALVLGDSAGMAVRYGLQDLPRIYGSTRELARLALGLLAVGQDRSAAAVNAPFHTANF